MRKIWVYRFVMRSYKHALEVKPENVLSYCNFLRAKMKRFFQWSMRPLLLVGLFCVVIGSSVLMVILFMKPEVKRPDLVGERIRVPIMSIESGGEATIPGVVGNKGVEEKPLEGGMSEEEKPMVSKPPEPSMMISRRGLDERVVVIDGIKIREDEKTQAGERRSKDKVFGQEIVVEDIKIKEKIPRKISLRKEPSASEIQGKSAREISQSQSITRDTVELKRKRGPIKATPTKTPKTKEKRVGFMLTKEMGEGKRVRKVEDKIAKKDMVGDKKAISPVGASSPLVKSGTAITAQKSVPQLNQLKHTHDLKDTKALNEYDAPSDLKDKSLSIAHFPMESNLSIQAEEKIVQSKRPSLIPTEEEVKQIFADYVERYTQKDIDGFLSLFSPKAVQNLREGFDEIRGIYSDFFDKSQELQYNIEDMRIQIYQNTVHVIARYEVEQISKRGGRRGIWRGDIRWILVRENGDLKISSLDYRHQKSP
ncbi:MAG: YybH family protein [Candidatus Hodarchaeota archaeon]